MLLLRVLESLVGSALLAMALGTALIRGGIDEPLAADEPEADPVVSSQPVDHR